MEYITDSFKLEYEKLPSERFLDRLRALYLRRRR